MSKNNDDSFGKELLANLEDLGLTNKEARVYIALLPLHNTGASKLIEATGLHGQFVYTALARLEKLGLARHIIQNGRKKFNAGAPERILALVEEKKRSAESVMLQLGKLLAGPHRQSSEVCEGRDAFVAQEFAVLEKTGEGGEIMVLGGGGDAYISLLGQEMNEYEKVRIAKRITLRHISTPERRNYLKIMAQTRGFFDYRVLQDAAPGVNVCIYPGGLVFQLFGEPVTSFTLINKEVSDGYRRFFEVLWGMSAK